MAAAALAIRQLEEARYVKMEYCICRNMSSYYLEKILIVL